MQQRRDTVMSQNHRTLGLLRHTRSNHTDITIKQQRTYNQTFAHKVKNGQPNNNSSSTADQVTKQSSNGFDISNKDHNQYRTNDDATPKATSINNISKDMQFVIPVSDLEKVTVQFPEKDKLFSADINGTYIVSKGLDVNGYFTKTSLKKKTSSKQGTFKSVLYQPNTTY